MQVRANYSYIDSLLEAAHRSNAFYPGRSLPIRKFYALPIARPGDFFCDLYNNQKNNYLYAVMVPARYAGQDERESGENPEQYSLL